MGNQQGILEDLSPYIIVFILYIYIYSVEKWKTKKKRAITEG